MAVHRRCLTMTLTEKFQMSATMPVVNTHEALGPVTIYLDAQLLQAARERSASMQVSLSAAIVEALRESLLSTYRSEREQEILKAVERNFHALRRLDQRLAVETRGAERDGRVGNAILLQPHHTDSGGGPRPRRSSAASSVFMDIWTHWPRIFARASPF